MFSSSSQKLLQSILNAIVFLLFSHTAYAVSVLSDGTRNFMYSTGIDLGGGVVDNQYSLVEIGASTFSPGLNMTVVSAGFLSSNNSDSQWISHAGTSNLANTTYKAATVLDLTGIDLNANTFSLSGYWVSDNKGLDILVNGVSTGQTNTGSHPLQPDSDSDNLFTLSSATSPLISGVNTVEFLWENGTPTFTAPSPVALRVLLDSYSITPVPVPAAVWLFGSGLLAIAAVRRKDD